MIDDASNIPPTAKMPVERLIAALRSPLPEGFEWDFRHRETCACGLCDRLGLDGQAIQYAIGKLDRIFDHPCFAGERDDIVPLYGVPARDVTPAMVADALERLVAASGW